MSIKLMNLVWDDTELSGSELLLMLALADHANDEGFCFPSVPRLAMRARISQRQAIRLLHKLRQDGYFKIAKQGNGRGHSTLYMLTLKGDIVMSPFSPGKGDITMSPLPEKRVTNGTQRVTSSAIKGDIAMSPDPIEPPIEPPGGSSPPILTDWNQFLSALCWVCYKHQKVDTLTDIQQQQLRAEAKRIQEAGHCKDDLRLWFQKVWKLDWHWKKDKARPAPVDVRVSIASVDAEAPEGFDEKDHPATVHVNGFAPPTLPNAGDAAKLKTQAYLDNIPDRTPRRIIRNEELQASRQRDSEQAQERRKQALLQQARSNP